jgi:hypothetical protein
VLKGAGRERVLLLGACCITWAASLSRLDQSLWQDEASSVWLARMPVTSLLGGPCDPHPPGYYLLLKAWLPGGASEPWLRLPSLLAAVLAVALAYRLGREVCGRRCAWLGALLLAWHPLQSWYAGEARMYALAQVMGLLVAWLGWRLLSGALQRPGYARAAAAYGLAGVLGLGIDYAVLLPMAGLSLVWLARGRPRARRWLGLQAAVLLAAGGLWLHANQLQALRGSYLPVFVAVQANRLGLEITPATAGRLLQFAALGLALVSLGLTWYWPRRTGRWPDRRLLRPALLGMWGGLLLLAALPRAYTLKRELVVLLPYLALVTGYALAGRRHPGLPGGELAAGLGLLVTLLVLPHHQREPWRAVVTGLVDRGPGPAAVVWVDELAVPVFDYYLGRSPAANAPIRWAPLRGRELPRLPDLAPRRGDMLWLLTSENPYRHLIALLPPDFYGTYQAVEEHHQTGIGLYGYRRRTEGGLDQLDVPAPSRLDAWGLLLPSPLDACRPE